MSTAGGARADVEESVLELLRAAGEPVREAVLYERIRERLDDVDPELLLAVLERLATLGQLHMAVEHELPGRDPAPFQPRFWHVVG
jgi:hypothetical protein